MKLPIFDSYTTFKKRRLLYHEIKSHKMTNNQKKNLQSSIYGTFSSTLIVEISFS